MRFLSDLCQLSMTYVHDSIHSLYSTFLFSSRLLSQLSFESQLKDFIHQVEMKIPPIFVRSLELAQSINHGNVLLSVYGSNYRLSFRKNRAPLRTVLHTKPTEYFHSENCSCQLQMKCLTPAAFIWPQYLRLKGLFIGCLASESLLSSTLECFYDMNCINVIDQQILGDVNIPPLNTNIQSKYSMNVTINDLVEQNIHGIMVNKCLL